jgi:hypothetical protein
MHEHVRIRLVGQVPLNRLIGAVGVTDEDLKRFLDHRVETAPDLGGKPRNLPRTGDENARHGAAYAARAGL